MMPLDQFLKDFLMSLKPLPSILILYAFSILNLMSTNTIWHHKSSNVLFLATMSHSRYKFIGGFITFKDKASIIERLKTDKFAFIRELFELLNVGNAKYRYLSTML